MSARRSKTTSRRGQPNWAKRFDQNPSRVRNEHDSYVTVPLSNSTDEACRTTAAGQCHDRVEGLMSCTSNAHSGATFTPQAAGPRKSSISISDNAGSGVQTILLPGVGSAINTSPSSLTLSGQPVGTPSAAMSVVIANEGSAAVNLWQIALIGAANPV